jgi:hypothetical protein
MATSLRQRILDRPQELYDMILDFTFTANPRTLEITADYQPPPTLQVSRATRRTFANSYFGPGSVFSFPRQEPLYPLDVKSR